jgi:Raf kinase inhibitor-like YbhB/YbcL family protein
VTAARVVLLVLVLAVLVTGCGGGGGSKSQGSSAPPVPSGSTLGLSSTAFTNGARIPTRYTCDGQNTSPQLTWTLVPTRTRSLALLMEDPDGPGGPFVHWTVYDIPRGSASTAPDSVPRGSVQGTNSFGDAKYEGPCPPKGDKPHHYVFRVYALDDDLGLKAGASPDDVRQAIKQHAIATGVLTGDYSR